MLCDKDYSPQDSEIFTEPSGAHESTTHDVDIVRFEEVGSTAVVGESSSILPAERSAESRYQSDVVNFLSRPIYMGDVIWKPADVAGYKLKTLNIPSELLTKTMISQKLAGHRFLRADFRIRVQVNAQPFNAGMLLVYFVPLRESLTKTPSHDSHFGGKTGYRCVSLNVRSETSCELLVPYASSLNYYDLIAFFGELGTFYVEVYSPLTGGDDVDVSCWLSMENIEVSVPTGLGVIGSDQMADAEHSTAGSRVGVVGKTARIVSDFAGNLAAVPALAGRIRPIGWLADAVAGVAEIFGFSKPQNVKDVERVVVVPGAEMANFNGVCQSKVLALDARNSIIGPRSMDGSNEDQMSFAHLLSKWIYTDRFKFSKTDLSTAVIWSWPVNPLSCRKTLKPVGDPVQTGTNRYWNNTMLSYVGSLFRLWRGSIVYKMRFVSTAFHTGRLEIAFVPGAVETTSADSIDVTKVNKVVVDLRDACEFEFTVPFVYALNWGSCLRVGKTATNTDLCDSVPIGMIYARVINSLRAPSTASSSIEIIVESRAGDDFEFANPIMPVTSELTIAFDSPGDFGVITDVTGVTWPNDSAGKVEKFYQGLRPTPAEQQDIDAGAAEAQTTVIAPAPVEQEKSVPIYRWKPGDAFPMPPDGPLWMENADDRSVVFLMGVKAGVYRDTASGYDFFTKYVKIVGIDQMDFVNDSKPKADFAGLGIGEKIVSFRQILKRYHYFNARVYAGDKKGEIVLPFKTNWSATPADRLIGRLDGMFDWITGLYRWRTGGMRVALSLNPTATDTANETKSAVMVGSIYPIDVRDDDIDFSDQDVFNYLGTAIVEAYPDREGFMEFTVPHYSQFPIVPTGVGAPPYIDYNSISVNGAMGCDYGSGIFISARSRCRIMRSIGEDFNYDYSLGPPLTYTFFPLVSEKKGEDIRVHEIRAYKEKLRSKDAKELAVTKATVKKWKSVVSTLENGDIAKEITALSL